MNDISVDQTRHIDRLLAENLPSCEGFAALLPQMAGASPLDVRSALVRIEGPEDRASRARALLEDANKPGSPASPCPQPAALPLPHPLDAEWRFAEDAIERILDWLIASTGNGDELLLVGTPSIAAALRERDVDRSIRFLGPDDLICQSIAQLYEGDPRFSRSQGRSAAAAVVDPPWYDDVFHRMMVECAGRCLPGAPVLTVRPRAATRPGMEEDFDRMLRDAASLGLRRTNGDSFEITYRTPLFERASFETAGIRADIGDWRRGDSLVLSAGDPAGPFASRVHRRSGYVELMLYGCRIRLLLGFEGGPPLPESVEAQEISTSISARSPTRRSANLWTSTNRALRVEEGPALGALVTLAENADQVLLEGFTCDENDSMGRRGVEAKDDMIQALTALVDREVADATRLVGDDTWARDAKGFVFSNAHSSTSLMPTAGASASAISSKKGGRGSESI